MYRAYFGMGDRDQALIACGRLLSSTSFIELNSQATALQLLLSHPCCLGAEPGVVYAHHTPLRGSSLPPALPGAPLSI